MEIERKFLVRSLPDNLEQYPHSQIKQAYISTSPVIRLRQKAEQYILTVKGPGLLEREEVEFSLQAADFYRLMTKTDGCVIEKTRYCIPWHEFTIELDLFEGALKGFIMAEIEFPDKATALSAAIPDWFGEDVTMDSHFHNSYLSTMTESQIDDFLLYLKQKQYSGQN